MLSAWRYGSDTKEVAVARAYDPANGRSSKIQACKICREKKTRCDGDGYGACNRCRCKGLTCEYAGCAKPKRSPRLSRSTAASSICKPRPQSARKHGLLGAGADSDSSDARSDKTVSPVPWHMGVGMGMGMGAGAGPLPVFDAAANFAIDPLLLQGVHEPCGTGFELPGTAGLDTQYLVAGSVCHGLQDSGFHVSWEHGDDEAPTPRQYGHGHGYESRWSLNGVA
ncbi:Zn(2)-C6 fungal-type DNA-binding domain protein [Metarhizium album ARSEF 1941]|uniref:Zn(2)-C6 fungal-type DNA-binding domain protein n=1 Tax=Metarhizium album (strain ARSEF 1941) TaxID=1081103 RepID=A0A0B2WQY7_METAS|nr:Zn(2)-C6 fungal-type DNA-binding domain protein [Metarhizium album ARSEF 1941]KHN98476.1 Zn(2)-C6 fungal-type DNA-binding domain protein [Metarhizium album ARSEF 1941]